MRWKRDEETEEKPCEEAEAEIGERRPRTKNLPAPPAPPPKLLEEQGPADTSLSDASSLPTGRE